MSQEIWSSINPLTTTGTALSALLVGFKDAIMTGCAGTSRPSNLQAGGMWIDTTNQGTPTFYWSFKIYTGSTDLEIFRLSVLNGFGGTLFGDSEFDVKEIGDDTTGPILRLIKNRVDNNGQVLNNDTVAELRFVGCTDAGLAQTNAYLRFTGSNDETTTSYGGTLSFASTPDASNTITEHFRFVGAVVETVKPHKINSERSVSQNIATSANITALDASKITAEMTGSTATNIQGIDATKASQVIHIHNRSTATITLKHENASATATNRLKLPTSADITIIPDGTAVLYYCTTDTRWKIMAITAPKPVKTIEGPFWGATNSWTAPAGKAKIRVTGRYRVGPIDCNSMSPNGRASVFLRDNYGNLYAWGDNNIAKLGVGDTTGAAVNRSSPVAVLGALVGTNVKTWASPLQGGGNNGAPGLQSCVISDKGDAYCWGGNFQGDIGDGTTGVVRSVPVAVTGKLKFSSILNTTFGTFGLSPNNKLYSWGNAGSAFLANGTTSCSSPVAVLGGLKFATYQYGSSTMFGQTVDGSVYAWGNNNGAFGNGSASGSASSPIAVLGGLKFAQVSANANTDDVVAIDASGNAYAWGNNSQGQLGVGDITPRSSPVAVLGGLKFKRVFAGVACFFGLTSDGTAYAWGSNSNSLILGVGDANARSSPVAVLGGLKFTELFPHAQGCFGKATDGTMYAWGYSSNGVSGTGLTDVVLSSPIAVLGGLKFEHFTTNGVAAFGLTSDGVAYAWGDNAVGELGTGDLVNRSSPVAVFGPALPGIRKFGPIEIDVVAGTTYAIALNQGNCFFGNTLLDQDLDQIFIEYN